MKKRYLLYTLLGMVAFGVTCSLFKTPTSPPPVSRTTDIVSPGLGSAYSFDSTITILWKNVARFGSIVRICLLNRDSVIDTLSRAALNTGIFSTKLKSADYALFKNTRTRYRISMADTLNANSMDTSNYFTLFSPYSGNIAIVTPHNNEGFRAGGYCRVQWVAPLTIGTYVSVDLYNDGKKTVSLSSMTSNDTMGRTLTIPSLMATDSTYAIRVSSYSDPSLYAEATNLSIIGIAKSDSFENDDTRNKASLLLNQVPQKHTFSFSDTDWVKFPVKPGNLYMATSIGAATHYAYGYSQKDSLFKIVSGTSLTVPFSPLANDTVFIRLTSYSAADTASYTLSLAVRPVDEVLKISRPSLGASLSCGTYDSLIWKSDSSVFGANVYLYLCKGSSTVTAVSTSVPFSGSMGWYVPSGLETGNNYRIKLQRISGSAVYAYSDSFSITGVSNDKYEYDNTRSAAHSIPANTLENHILTLGDTDWVKIPMVPQSLYRVATASAYSIATALYRGTSTTQLNSNYGTAISFLVSTTTNDSLFVRVSPYATISADSLSYSIIINRIDSSTIPGITYPAAGGSVQAGTMETVQWAVDTALFGSYVTLGLYYDTTFVDSIGKYIPNNGRYVWNIPPKDTAGNKYRIKITSYLYPAIGKLSAPFSIAGVEADKYENDNLRSKASAMAVDEVQQRTLTLRDSDWVKVPLESGVTYRIMNKATYLQDVSLFYGSSANYFYDNSTGPLSYSYTPVSSDTLFVLVTQYLSSVTYTGPYTLTVAKMDTSNANRIVFPSAGTTVYTGTPSTISWLSDSTTFGRYVNLTLCVDTVPFMSIVTSLGNSGTYAWTPVTGIASGSRYRVKLTSYTNPALSRLSDVFSIVGQIPDVYENDNSVQKATVFSLDSTQSRTLSLYDTDWVKLPVASGTSYTITSKASFYHSLYIYRSASLINLFAGSSSVNTFTVAGSANDTLFVMVRTYSASASYTGAYTLNIKQLDLTNIGKITSPGGGAVLSTGTSYVIRWNADTAAYGTAVSLQLCNDTNAILSIIAGLSNSGLYTWNIPSGLGTDSRYRIKLLSYLNTSIYRYSDTFTINGLARDLYEPDNNRASARLIPFDSLISRTISLGDTDWVKVPLIGGELYSITTKASFFHYIYLYRGASASYYNYGSSTANSMFYTSAAAETLYVMVRQYSPSVSYAGSYTIMVKKIDPANIGAVLAPSAGTAITAGTIFTIRWNPDSASYGTAVSLTLCLDTNPTYSIASSLSNSGTYSWSVPSAFSTDSRYRIKLASYNYPQIARFSDTFTINGLASDPYENDNNRSIARLISVDSLISRTLSLGDTDWVKAPLLGGSIYSVDTKASFLHYTYTYRGAGVSYDSYGYNAANYLFVAPTAAETLYVMVRPYSASVSYAGPYTITIKKIDPASIGTIVAPSAGTTLTGGNSFVIRWTPDSASYGTTINLSLCLDTNPMFTIYSAISNSGTYSWSVPSAFSTDTRYRIKLSSYSFPQIARYSDTFTIMGLSADPMEYDNVKTRARLIAVDSIYARTLAYSDTDWVKIPVNAQTQYRIETKGAISHYTYMYFGQSTSYVNYASYTDNILRYVPATNDTLFVQVRQYSLSTSYTGAYTVQVRKIDTAAIAGVTAPSAADTLHPGTIYAVKWTPDTVSFSSLVSLALYNDTTFQSTIVSGMSTIAGVYAWTVPSTMTAGNKYRIKLYSYSYSTVAKFGSYFRIAATHGAASNQSIKQPDEVTIAH